MIYFLAVVHKLQLYELCNLFCRLKNCFNFAVEPVTFLRPLENVLLNDVGLSAKFICEVSKTGLKADWLKNKQPVKKSDKYSLTDDGCVHTLMVQDAQAQDEAEYTVKLANVESRASLTIRGKCFAFNQIHHQLIKEYVSPKHMYMLCNLNLFIFVYILNMMKTYILNLAALSTYLNFGQCDHDNLLYTEL